jgi:hypothetical protein
MLEGGTNSMSRVAIWTLLVCGLAMAGPQGGPNSWEALKRLAPGQSIEVIQQKGESLKGKLAGVSEDSIAVATRRQTIAVPRPTVSRVLISGRRRTYMLVGAAIGAAAGAGLGAAGGESLAQGSGGDFANLKPVITVGGGAVGAAIGAMVGSLAGKRGAIVYRAK